MSCCKTKFAETGSMPRRNEIIYLLGIDKEDMVEVREKMEKRFEDGKTVPGTKSSPHFISQSASQIGHKLQWGWVICEHPWLQNSNLRWYWQHCTIVLHLLCVQLVVMGRFGEESWWGARWYRCPIHATPHPHVPQKTLNWPQGGDSCYVPIKTLPLLYGH